MATAPSRYSQPPRIALPQIEGFDKEHFERQSKLLRKPILMKGAAASWPAISSWTPGYFAARFEDRAIKPSVDLPDTEVPYRYRDRDFRREMEMGEFVRHMDSGGRCYLDQMSLESLKELDADFDFGMFGLEDVKVIALWMGASTRSGLHYDWIDNLFAQVHGTKRAILVAPEETHCLYPFHDSYTKSQVAPEHPDLAAFPRFKEATLWEGIVEPGDVLFIPRGWWHYFSSLGISISLSCWYGSSFTPKDEMAHFLRMRIPGKWTSLVRDFIWYGVLQKPSEDRLYSLPPTGKMLYELIASFWTGRRN